MRLLICAGGTGGGVYPALAVLQAAGDRVKETLWVGGKDGMEAGLISRSSIPFKSISAAGVHGVGMRALPANLVKLTRGYFESKAILRDFCPDALLFTGGYVAVPMALAGRKTRTLLYVPDIEPGMALKSLAKFADIIALTDDSSRAFFSAKKNLVVTGYPTRADLAPILKEEALLMLDLQSDLPVLLVIGGSKGAHSLNQAVFENLGPLLEKTQLLHITGKPDHQAALQLKNSLESRLGSHYKVYEYMHDEINAAFSSATIALCRAGASTLGELPLFGLPAILVPYPYAWRYQKVNAGHLSGKGAAVIIENSNLSARLVPVLTDLLQDAPKLATMSRNMNALSVLGAAGHIADLLLGLTAKTGSGKAD